MLLRYTQQFCCGFDRNYFCQRNGAKTVNILSKITSLHFNLLFIEILMYKISVTWQSADIVQYWYWYTGKHHCHLMLWNNVYTRQCARGCDVSACTAGNKRIFSESARCKTDRPVTVPGQSCEKSSDSDHWPVNRCISSYHRKDRFFFLSSFIL